VQSKVLTVMLTDMKGFTETSSKVSRDEMMALVKRHDELIRPILQQFGGNVVKTIGDAFLVVFESPTNAVLCGLVIQHTLRQHNETATNGERIEVRVAINIGEVQLTEDDVFGDPVNLAARINGITEPGEIFFTDAVYLAMNKQEVPSSEIGQRRFKGVPEPVKLFQVIQDPVSDQYQKALDLAGRPSEAPPPSEEPLSGLGIPTRPSRKPLIAGLVVVVAAVAAAAAFLLLKGPDWTAQVREFSAQGGFPQAWHAIDARFSEEPGDPRVTPVALEVLEAELKTVIDRDGYEKSIERLKEHKEKRQFLEQIDDVIRRTRRENAFSILAKGKYQNWSPGLKILRELADERKSDPKAQYDLAKAYSGCTNMSHSTLFYMAARAIEADESYAGDEWIKKTILGLLREVKIRPGWSDSLRFYDVVAKHYAADVKDELGPLVTGDGDNARRNAYGILSRIGKLPEATVFEYHRLNLFRVDDSRARKEALEYLGKWLERRDEARVLLEGRKFDDIPALNRYRSFGARDSSDIIEKLFYDQCRDHLLKSVVAPGNVGLRHNSMKILNARGDATSEIVHRYHILNLTEYGMDQLRYRYGYLTDAFGYLKGGKIAKPEWRAEALKLVTKKQADLAAAKKNKYVRKDEDVVKWLEESLAAAHKALSGR